MQDSSHPASDATASDNVDARALSNTAETPAGARRWIVVPFLIQFIGCWLLLAITLFLDPFGLSNATRSYSQDVLNRLFSPFYPSDGHDSMAVALLRDEDLARFTRPSERDWPAPMAFHAKVLAAILRYQPKAVFVDLLFLDEVPDAQFAALARMARRYKARKVGLLFVGASERLNASDRTPLRQESLAAPRPGDLPLPLMEKLRTPTPSAVTPKLSLLAADPDTNIEIVAGTVAPEDGVLRSYPLSSRLRDGRRAPSAASQLYELWTEEDFPSADAPHLELVWGSQPHEVNTRWMACTEPKGFFGRLGRLVLGARSLKNACPTTPTVPVTDLLLPGVDDDARDMIENKIVLYGTDLDAAGDLFVTALSDHLPGVYVHAMALDNLVVYGDGYIRRDVRALGIRINESHVEYLVAIPILALILATYLTFLEARIVRRWGAPGVRVARAMVPLGGAFALALLMLVLYFGFRMAPVNWVGLLALYAPLERLARSRPVERWCERVISGSARILATLRQ